MPFTQAPQAVAAFSANGGADGYVTVADASKFYPGARVWIRSNTVESKEYMITEVIAATNKIGVREVLEMGTGPRYGRTPVNQFLVADGAQINQESQVVDVELSNFQKLVRP